jgi:hypothetical protein
MYMKANLGKEDGSSGLRSDEEVVVVEEEGEP